MSVCASAKRFEVPWKSLIEVIASQKRKVINLKRPDTLRSMVQLGLLMPRSAFQKTPSRSCRAARDVAKHWIRITGTVGVATVQDC